MQIPGNTGCVVGAALLLLVLSACGGGGGGAATKTLSADQTTYESFELNGGAFGIASRLPFGGGTLVGGQHYFYASGTRLSVSPAVADQFATPMRTSFSTALALPTVPPTRVVQGGKIWVSSASALRKISYMGTGVRFDIYADDGQTVLESVLRHDFSNVPLGGAMAGAPQEFLAAYPVQNWIGANIFVADSTWQPGAAYLKYHDTRIGDTVIADDCPATAFSVPPKTPVVTTTEAVTPCLTGKTLASFFPVTLYRGHPQEVYDEGDGSYISFQGLRMWVATRPLPAGMEPTPYYRVFFELNGNVYFGALMKDGADFRFRQSDGSVVDYALSVNQVAVTSLRQGLIVAGSPGSRAGSAATVPTLDIFQIGGQGINGMLSAADLRKHYNVPASLTGAGQTIALIEGPGIGDIASDLNVYSQVHGLPLCTTVNPCLTRVNPTAVSSLTGDWSDEIALDAEMVHAMAPAAHILIVTLKSYSDADIAEAITTAAQQPGVVAISMSFGRVPPSDPSVMENAFAAAQASFGTVLLASSGDDGSVTLNTYPAASPKVTAVGGTRITALQVSGAGVSESAWTFSGSGASAFAQPAWQTQLSPLIQGSRHFPDVVAVADGWNSPVATYSRQAWRAGGGTSAASPIWAGIAALLAQSLSDAGKSLPALVKATPGGFNGLLYQSQLSQSGSSGYFDIITGSNALPSTLNSSCLACSATAGYDGVSGWGAPNVDPLASALRTLAH